MKYHVKRNGQEYGPYTLAELQRYVSQGNIQLSDLARGEGLEEWLPVERIIGNVPVQPPPATPNYGQVPVYGSAIPGPGAQPGAPFGGWPLPPGLHWVIVLVLTLVTCGLFSSVWMFVQAIFVSKLRTGSKPLIFYAIGIPLLFAGQVLNEMDPASSGMGALLLLGGIVLVIVGHFQMKSALEEHYTHAEPLNLLLSGGMTFFFNVFYFQYHLTRIRNWKTTGVVQ